ncbi:50S ribosomal protein L1 [Candidatus Woesearchaeota archaeon]|nr:50S ribosomal protein L1 [Candidatus Woesearchaeota archaeon]
MNKENISKIIKKLRESKNKRRFKQGFDVIVNLKQIDLKKPDQKVETFLVLPNGNGKKLKVCAFVDKELINDAKAIFDRTIPKEDFPKIPKKELKNIAREFDFFVAQANCMVDIAKVFGRALGSKGKMPNPKAGCVITPGTNLKDLYNKLQKTIKVVTRSEPIIKVLVGKEDMDDKKIEENIAIVYNTLLQVLPQEKNNIKNVLLKLTMGAPLPID